MIGEQNLDEFLRQQGWSLPQEKIINKQQENEDLRNFLVAEGWTKPPPEIPPQVKPMSVTDVAWETIKGGFDKLLGTAAGTVEAAGTVVSGIPSYIAGVGVQAGKTLFDWWKSGFRDIETLEAIETLEPPIITRQLLRRLGENKTVKEKVATLGTYVPKTQEGQAFAEVAVAPISAYFWGVRKIAELMTDDPDEQEGIIFLGDVAIILGLPMAKKAFARGKPIDVAKVLKEVKESPDVPQEFKVKAEYVTKPKERRYPAFWPKDAPQSWYEVWDATSGQGVRPFKDASGKFIELEEYQNVPKQLRRKAGVAPDEAAKSAGFEDSEAMYRAFEYEKRVVTEEAVREAEARAFEEAAKVKPKVDLGEEFMEFKEIPLEKKEVAKESWQKKKAESERPPTEWGPEEAIKAKEVLPPVEKEPIKPAKEVPIREFKMKEEWKVKATPEEQMKIAEKRAEEGLEEIGGVGEAGVEEKISLPYKEWQKTAEGGFVDMEIGKTFGESKKSHVYQAIFDRFHAIKKLTDIVKKEGAELPPVKDPYMNIRNYLGVQGKAETKLMYKRFKVDTKGNIQFKGKSLRDILEPVNKRIDDFEYYLVARRVPELEGRGIKTGIDVKVAKDFIATHKDFEPIAKEFTEYHHSLLDELVDAGFLSKSKAGVIKKHNQMYAPFARVVEDLKTYGHIPSSNKVLSKIVSPLKRIKGSERPIISPLETTVKATYAITSVIERNRIANMILDLREVSPEIAKTITPFKPKMAVVATLEDGTKVYRPSVFQEKGVIEVMSKGERHFYKVPPDLYEAMSQLTETGHSWLTKMLSVPARILRTGATSTPEFAFRNPVRDQWFAFVNAKYGYIPGYDFAKGLFNLAKKPELYWKWKAAGGEWSMLVTLDRAASQANLKKVLGVADYKKYLKNPISFLEEVSMVGEMPTRLGVFERAQGKASDIEAAFQSREGSIDFARRGAKTKTISSLYTFLNARLQGMEKMIRTAKESPVKTTAKIMAVAVIPSVINYLMNRDDSTYWEIPEWQRDLFWIIPIKRGEPKVKTVFKEEEKKTRKKGFYLRIPKGDVGVIFGTSTEKILEFMDKDKGGRAELDKLAVNIIKECSPISDVGGFLPVAFRVPVEAWTNTKFFYDRPIVPESRIGLERKYQYSAFTSEVAKGLGKIFNISPSKIEHMITGYGAGLARHALKLSDGILAEMGIVPEKVKRPKELADYPVLQAFAVRDPIGFGSESVQDFYETLEKLDKFQSTRKFLREKGQKEELSKWIKKHPKESAIMAEKEMRERGGLYSEFGTVRNSLASLRKMKEAVLESKEATVEEKEKIVDEIHAMVMQMVITVLSQYRALETKLRIK